MACSAVRSTYLRPDYAKSDRLKTKRLAVVTSPFPAGSEKIAGLWSLLARRYVNQKRNFLAKQELAEREAPQSGDSSSFTMRYCHDGLEGVLWLRPFAHVEGDRVRAQLQATLNRCSDGQTVWKADAAGTWPSSDATLKELTAQYTTEIGPEVTPYVAPSFRILKQTLDTLPDPILADEDINEKIELGE